jgi:hypothetical protein
MQKKRGPQSRQRNRYPGTCDHCKQAVDPEKGVIVYHSGACHVRCWQCYNDTGLRNADRKGNALYRLLHGPITRSYVR